MKENNEFPQGNPSETSSPQQSTPQETSLTETIAASAEVLEQDIYNPVHRAQASEEYTQARIERDGRESVPPGALPENNPYLRQFQAEQSAANEDVAPQSGETRPDPLRNIQHLQYATFNNGGAHRLGRQAHIRRKASA